ncbi:MAG TPA: short-chain dehydrogenase, partial [Marinilabiliaceae bacterium]|nr:short-chain dehydrogenase [Marinilabiliaceae bacterium]
MVNKVVIITGASSGIGLACAKEYASRGAAVSICARSTDKLEEIKNELQYPVAGRLKFIFDF